MGARHPLPWFQWQCGPLPTSSPPLTTSAGNCLHLTLGSPHTIASPGGHLYHFSWSAQDTAGRKLPSCQNKAEIPLKTKGGWKVKAFPTVEAEGMDHVMESFSVGSESVQLKSRRKA